MWFHFLVGGLSYEKDICFCLDDSAWVRPVWGPVTPEKALQVAQKVFASAPATKAVDASSLQIVWDGEFEHTKNAQDPAFYVISRPEGGFVMVAGNDNVQPVLGFSFENDFKVEGMPENVRWWMEQIKGYARSAISQTPEIFDEWSQFEETKAVITTVTDEFELSRTLPWDQDDPANYYAPSVSGQDAKSVCGCVPLAFAEVMAWFGTANANAGAGDVVSYTYDAYNPVTHDFTTSVTIPVHTLGTVYEWASYQSLNTSEKFYAEASTDLGRNLGQLVYDIGTILQVEFNSGTYGGTAGNTVYLDRLTTMLHYNKAARDLSRSNYSSAQWLNMLVNEITNHPLVYSGQDTGAQGGHAFVADGYATNTLSGRKVIRFNLGWGGSCTGYYDVFTDINTANGYNFFDGMSAVFDFTPDKEGTSSFIQELSYFFDGANGGISGVFDGSDPVKITIKNVKSSGSADFDGYLALFRIDKNGVKDSQLTLDDSFSLPVGYYYPSFSYFVNDLTSPVFGDKVAAYYKIGDGEYSHPLLGGASGAIITEVPYFPAAAIKKKASYSINEDFVFELTNHYYSYQNSTWYVTTPGGVRTAYVLDQSDRVKLTETGDYKIEAETPGQETVVTYITVE